MRVVCTNTQILRKEPGNISGGDSKVKEKKRSYKHSSDNTSSQIMIQWHAARGLLPSHL